MHITVVGLGYVGLANAALLSREHDVIGLDIDLERVMTVNSGHSTVEDREMDEWLANQPLRLWATDDEKIAYRGAKYVVIAVPTDFDDETGKFDTSIVERVIAEVLWVNPAATMVIRSTVPVGFTERMITKHRLQVDQLLFVPEFLREGSALLDTLHPSRVIIGSLSPVNTKSIEFGQMLSQYAGCGFTMMHPGEAESVKLFSNTYLAMRVAFFNELDTFAVHHDLSAERIVEGVTGDPRIGHGYSNPSFGYGGYCLPKDTKQLQANYGDIPQSLISAIVDSNEKRKSVITSMILQRMPDDSTIGVYRVNAKSGSENFRDSAVRGIMRRLKMLDYTVIVFEPELAEAHFEGCEVVSDLGEFLHRSDLILANRDDDELEPARKKVLTRDIYQRD